MCTGRQRPGLWPLVLTACLAIASCSSPPPELPAPAPAPVPEARVQNLLLIIVDTLRADHLGAYGYTLRPTSPNLDELAQRSTVFDRAYSHAPWTLPSVASIMTSRQPRDHGVLKWSHRLLPDYSTIAEVLHDDGFHTMAVVAHLLFEPDYGFAQGFDSYDRSILDRGNPELVTSSDAVTDKLIQALDDRPPGQRWFAWAHYFDPHSDYIKQPGFDFGDEVEELYDSDVAFTDHHIGRLLEYLQEHDMMADTAIAFIADHGEEFMEHGRYGHTMTLYDELIRVPLMIYVPGLAPGRVAGLVPALDLAPTLLALAGLPAPDGFDGQSLPIASGKFTATEQPVFSETRRGIQLRGVREGDWKFVRDVERERDELFNLRSDPDETHDLSDSEPERRRELSARLRANYKTPTTRVEERSLPERIRKRLENLGYLD